jgi:hypothetical protein
MGEKCGTGNKKPGLVGRVFPESGAGNEIRTRDPNLGKVVLYQLSYSRLLSEGVASQRLRILLISVRPSTIFVKNL